MENSLTQLETYKSFYPDLDHIQKLTLKDLDSLTEVDWHVITPSHFMDSVKKTKEDVSECKLAIGYVLFDVICLAVGAVGLRSSVNASVAIKMAEAAEPVLSQIETIIAKIGAENASTIDRAWGVFQILQTIWSGGLGGAVFNAFKNSLTWYNAILYGVTGVATIVAAFATDGVALVAEIVILLATFGFLTVDVSHAITVCSLSPSTPPTGPKPKSGDAYKPSIAIRTTSNNFITVVNNGGLGGPNNSTSIIHTDATQVGPWEKFKLIPISMENKTFALQTNTGNYITATNGGGLGGPNNNTSIIHTDATQVGPWEKLVVILQEDGTYTISTTSGNYITATNGGGLGGPNNDTSIIHTDATQVGPWETFYFDSL